MLTCYHPVLGTYLNLPEQLCLSARLQVLQSLAPEAVLRIQQDAVLVRVGVASIPAILVLLIGIRGILAGVGVAGIPALLVPLVGIMPLVGIPVLVEWVGVGDIPLL